jgi:hypothetical protein
VTVAVTTTSMPSSVHSVIVAPFDATMVPALAQALAAPDNTDCAPARAPRSAAT